MLYNLGSLQQQSPKSLAHVDSVLGRDSMGFYGIWKFKFPTVINGQCVFPEGRHSKILNKNLKKNLLIANMAVILLLLLQRQPKLN